MDKNERPATTKRPWYPKTRQNHRRANTTKTTKPPTHSVASRLLSPSRVSLFNLSGFRYFALTVTSSSDYPKVLLSREIDCFGLVVCRGRGRINHFSRVTLCDPAKQTVLWHTLRSFDRFPSSSVSCGSSKWNAGAKVLFQFAGWRLFVDIYMYIGSRS